MGEEIEKGRELWNTRCSLRRVHHREAAQELAVGQGAVAVLVERVHDRIDLGVC